MGKKTVAFILFPEGTPLDLIGPLQILAGLPLANPEYEVSVVGARVEPTATDVPLKLVPQKTFDQAPDPYIVVVPGGGMGAIRAMGDGAIREYLLAAAGSANTIASVCTGALIVGAAGLLEGRNATTHWAYGTLLERLGATYVPERWVEDGKFISAAGVSAGIDMALHLGARLTSEELAKEAQLGIEYDPEPPFGPIDWSAVDRQAYLPAQIQMVKQLLADHPDLVTRLTG